MKDLVDENALRELGLYEYKSNIILTLTKLYNLLYSIYKYSLGYGVLKSYENDYETLSNDEVKNRILNTFMSLPMTKLDALKIRDGMLKYFIDNSVEVYSTLRYTTDIDMIKAIFINSIELLDMHGYKKLGSRPTTEVDDVRKRYQMFCTKFPANKGTFANNYLKEFMICVINEYIHPDKIYIDIPWYKKVFNMKRLIQISTGIVISIWYQYFIIVKDIL